MASLGDAEGAPVCPECLTALGAGLLKKGESVPKHARYGFRVSPRKPPCRGWIAQLPPSTE